MCVCVCVWVGGCLCLRVGNYINKSEDNDKRVF